MKEVGGGERKEWMKPWCEGVGSCIDGGGKGN